MPRAVHWSSGDGDDQVSATRAAGAAGVGDGKGVWVGGATVGAGEGVEVGIGEGTGVAVGGSTIVGAQAEKIKIDNSRQKITNIACLFTGVTFFYTAVFG